MTTPAPAHHFFRRLAIAWGILLLVTLVGLVPPLRKSSSEMGMALGDTTVAEAEVIENPETVTPGNETRTIVSPDGSTTTITVTEIDGSTETKTVTTQAIVGGATVDPEMRRFVKTFDGFRSQLRDIGLAKGAYAFVEGVLGFIRRSTGIGTPKVAEGQE